VIAPLFFHRLDFLCCAFSGSFVQENGFVLLAKSFKDGERTYAESV
jgi:hypothetical protein